jgi:hypothetical protein
MEGRKLPPITAPDCEVQLSTFIGNYYETTKFNLVLFPETSTKVLSLENIIFLRYYKNDIFHI